jgi:O-antigen/teichoic acid export membrane protein
MADPINRTLNLARFARHSTVYAAGNIINRVGAFLLLPLYTNYLSLAEYGALELFYTASAIVSGLLSVGLAHATLRFYFEYSNESDRRSLVRTSFFAILGLGVFGALLVLPWSSQIASALFSHNEYRWGVPLVLITMIFELGSQVCLAYIRAVERSMFFVGVAVAKLILQVLLNTILVGKFDAGVEGVLLGNLVAVFVGWLILTSFTLSQCGIGFEKSKILPVLRYSAPFLYATIVSLVAGNFDRVFLGTKLSIAALGTYALASKFSSLLTELIGDPFNRSYGAFRFSIMGKPDAAIIQERITRYFAAGLFAASLGIALFTHDILAMTSDEQFWSAANYTPLLVIVALLRAIIYPMQTGVLYGKKSAQLFYIKVLATGVGTALTISLIGALSITGVCIALIVSAAVELVATDYLSQKIFPVRYQWRRIALGAALAFTFYLAAWPINTLAMVWSIPLKSVLWVGFLVALLLSPMLQKDEVQEIKRTLYALPRKVAR